MYKASPRVHIAEWDLDEAEGVVTPANTPFVSFSRQYVRMREGRATVTTSYFGEAGWQLADRGRIVFTAPTLGGTVTTATLELLGKDREGNMVVLGRSAIDAGHFAPIEFDITYEEYGLRLAVISGASAAVTTKALAQYYYRAGATTV